MQIHVEIFRYKYFDVNVNRSVADHYNTAAFSIQFQSFNIYSRHNMKLFKFLFYNNPEQLNHYKIQHGLLSCAQLVSIAFKEVPLKDIPSRTDLQKGNKKRDLR